MKKVFKSLSSFEIIASALVLLTMLIISTIQVVGRYAFNHSFSWSEECCRYLFIWYVYLTACFAVYERSHIKIDVAMDLFPPKIRPYIGIFGDVLFLVYAVIIAYYSSIYTKNMYVTGRVSLALGIKMAFVYLAIPVCHWLMSIHLLGNIVKDLLAERKKEGEE